MNGRKGGLGGSSHWAQFFCHQATTIATTAVAVVVSSLPRWAHLIVQQCFDGSLSSIIKRMLGSESEKLISVLLPLQRCASIIISTIFLLWMHIACMIYQNVTTASRIVLVENEIIASIHSDQTLLGGKIQVSCKGSGWRVADWQLWRYCLNLHIHSWMSMTLDSLIHLIVISNVYSQYIVCVIGGRSEPAIDILCYQQQTLTRDIICQLMTHIDDRY